MKAIVKIPGPLDERKKFWRKTVEFVDVNEKTGRCFVGQWLPANEKVELEIGSFILCYDEPGSVKHYYPLLRLFKVTEEENLELVFKYAGANFERSWALAIRNKIDTIIAQSKITNKIVLNEEEQSFIEKFSSFPDDRKKILLAHLKNLLN